MQADPIPAGFCQCGCGEKTRIARRTSTEKGWKRGEPLKFVNGHNGRKHTFDYEEDPATGCWNWLGSLTVCGYGQGRWQNQKFAAHRWYWEKRYGPIPKGLHLDHLCRNRRCVNPAHLEPVTPCKNAQRSSNAILIEEEVRQIRQAPREWGSGRALAERFGVHECTISAIRCGRLWPDVA